MLFRAQARNSGGPAFVSRPYYGTTEKQVLRSLRSHQDDSGGDYRSLPIENDSVTAFGIPGSNAAG
jgi:hypothetical protein